MSENGDTGARPENPFTRPLFIISGSLIVLAIIFGLIVFLVFPSTGNKLTPVAAPTSTATTTATAPADPAASICGLKAGDQTVPAKAPLTNWELLGKTAVPANPKGVGPGLISTTEVRTCYAHNPVGALYAAANIAGMGAEGRVKDVYQYLSASGPGRDKLLASNPTGTPTDVVSQIGGYQFVSYTGDSAVLNIAFSLSNGAFLSESLILQWEDGDWKLSIPTDGKGSYSQISDLDNFVAWSGGGD